MDSQSSAEEVMSEVEQRLSELFTRDTGGQTNRVVDYQMVKRAVEQLGMPDGSPEPMEGTDNANTAAEKKSGGPDFSYGGIKGTCKRKLYRDKEHRAVSGVCAGLGAYFDVDTTIVRLITLLVCFLWGTGLIAYLLMMIVVPAAKSPYEKCLMHGLNPTAENMSKFTVTK